MSRYHRLVSQRQRDKQLDERNQATFRESYLDHIVETAHIGVRNFANPMILGRKRKKPKHENLDSLISYLHKQNACADDDIDIDNDIDMKTESNNNNKRRQRDNDIVSSFERKHKRRKLRHSIEQIRNNENIQKSFYKSSNYSNISNDSYDTDDNHNSYCIWKFHHQRNQSQETIYESNYRCVLCLKYFDNIYGLQKHVICWHSKLTFDIKIIHQYLCIINILNKPSKMCYLSFNNNNNNNTNTDINEYYYGWINIWNNYYLKCDKQMRDEINDKYFMLENKQNENETESEIDIDKLYHTKWNFPDKLSMFMLSNTHKHKHKPNNKKGKIDIYATFTLSCNQFKNRRLTSLTHKEKLSMVEEVLSYPLMTGRMSKLCKYIGLKNIKYLKKLMAIYPMLLLLNRKAISLHLINKWNEWKCNIKKDIKLIQNVTNNDLNQINIKTIVQKINENEKGISSLSSMHKLWICTYILSKGGKSFISQFKNHVQNDLDNDMDNMDNMELNINITNSSLYSIYYNFCGYMMLCGQFPLSTQGMQTINKWWNSVKRMFGFGFNFNQHIYKRNNIKMTKKYKNFKQKNKNKNKNKVLSKKWNIRLNEKVEAIRDIIYGKQQIEYYMKMFDVKERTIIRWINNSKHILQKCEAQAGLDDIWGIYNDDDVQLEQQIIVVPQTAEVAEIKEEKMNINEVDNNNNNNKEEETQFKVFLDKAREYLNIRRPKRIRSKSIANNNNNNNNMSEQTMNMCMDLDGNNTEDSEYDPMNESANNRRVASNQHSGQFEREYKTRNVNLRRGRNRIRSYELRYNRGYYHGSTFIRVGDGDGDDDGNLNAYENESDTENECDDEWLLDWEKNLLFDFEDISFGEKLMMKYWNEFIREKNKNRIYASFMVPVKLIVFAQTHKEIICENNLKLPFLFHCITLWEFGFIEAKCIQEAMFIIHQYEKNKNNQHNVSNNLP